MKIIRSSILATALALFLPAVPSGQIQAQDCATAQTCEFLTCRTPARPVPSTLWGELRPAETSISADRDSTDHNGKSMTYDNTNAFWFTVDPENGWLFTAVTSGFEIWDARSTPDRPAKVTGVDGRRRGFPQFPANPELKFPISDVDAPAGDDTMLAVVGIGGVGLSIWNTSEKSSPKALYQDYGTNRDFVAVYAAKLGSVKMAFGASAAGGLRMYSMSQAANFSTTCLDAAPDTPCGVYKGNLGTRSNVTYVSGDGSLVALSSGTYRKGVEVWNLSNPNAPVLAGTFGEGDFSYGHAMWSESGSSRYLAVRAGSPEMLKIYDVSCAGSGSCVAGASPIATKVLNAPAAAKSFVTFSRSGTTPFLYLGAEQQCIGSERAEWLLDVSNPSLPRDITPPDGVAGGYATGYWQWYARKTATGFNSVGPFRAKFYGEYLYRAAFGIFDIHKLGTAKPNPAFTWSPSQIFVGTPITFTDQSTGSPTSWAWSFPGGSPVSTFLQNPSNVSFSTTGTKSVTLDVCNVFGCVQLAKSLSVFAPEAAVTDVTVSPATLTSCVTASFAATGVSGKDPLAYAWTVGSLGSPTPTVLPCTGATCSWVVPADWVDGTYEVAVKVTNAENPNGATATKQFVLDQQTLGFVALAPTSDPTTTGTVKFHTQTTGAKEWAWDFGTGSGYGAWSADPVTGPNPTFTYTVSGAYNIKVKIRDCTGAELESSTLSLNVTAIPLVADFSASCFSGFCAFDTGYPISFTDASTGSPETWAYDWNHTGTSSSSCNFGTPGASPQTSHTYTSAGTYQPCLRVVRGPDTSVIVHSKAIALATPAVAKVSLTGATSGTTGQPLSFYASATNCSPSPTGWNWSTGGGSGSSTSSSISITWSTAGNKNVSVSNSGCSGTSATRSVTVTSTTGGATLTAAYNYSPTTISMGQSVSFDGRTSQGSPTIYQWTFGDGSGTSDGSVVNHTFANGGTFQVTLSIAKPGTGSGCSLGYCTDTETKTITVSGTPIVPLVAMYSYSPTTINAGKPIAFDATASEGTPTIFEWTFGDGTAKATGSQVSHTFAEPGTYQVTLSVAKPGSGTGCSLGFCVDEEKKTVVVEKAKTGLCDDDPTALCLNKGRFKVQTEWKKPDGVTTGVGKPVGITDDTGYFWFEYDSNVELVAKVLDGCGVNGNFWVFAAGLTNIEVTLTVTDKQTGAVKVYTNVQGSAFEPIQDTKAFTCAAAKVATETYELPSFETPVDWVEVGENEPAPVGVPYVRTLAPEVTTNATCVPDATTLCLNKDRFRVEAWWQTNEGLGTGQAVALGGDTGYFWFFNKDNVELVIKVLDGCALNSRYWVFAGGLTNVGVRIIVTDMTTGLPKEYVNPIGQAFPPKQDTDAIAECH
ncbi:MAG: PKD domain-containing protein [Thermoanaerobaculia bacterium]|jgi:PKD repeat protein